MTVKELIKELEVFDPDDDVVIIDKQDNDRNIEEVNYTENGVSIYYY